MTERLLTPRLAVAFLTMLLVSGTYRAIYLCATGLLVVCLVALGVFCALTAERAVR